MNITFIGMSGAGKSTVGEAVAARLGFTFYDVDREMEREYNQALQDILDELGDEGFLHEQAQQVVNLRQVTDYVIAPGGSLVYTSSAMEFLKANSVVVYLKVSCGIVKQRIDLTHRGIVGMKEKTFEQLFAERERLYKTYADITIDADGKSVDQIIEEVLTQV